MWYYAKGKPREIIEHHGALAVTTLPDAELKGAPGGPPRQTLMPLTAQERLELGALAAEAERRAGYKIRRYFPDEGPFRRELYPQHLKFLAAGRSSVTERLFVKANRTGGTQAAACELTYHLTGDYPAWWPGRRFEQPVDAWAACDTGITTRDVCQLELYGPPHDPRTGFHEQAIEEDRRLASMLMLSMIDGECQ